MRRFLVAIAALAAWATCGPVAATGAAFTTTVATETSSFFDSTGAGNFTTLNPNSLDIRNFAGSTPNFESRAAVSFEGINLQSLGAIQSITLNLYETSTANAPMQVNIYGLAVTGALTLGDATASGTLLASYSDSALGAIQVTLNVSEVVSLLQSGGSLGLRLQGSAYGVNTQLGALGGPPVFPAPSLAVTYVASVPEPSSIALCGVAALVGLALARARRRPASA